MTEPNTLKRYELSEQTFGPTLVVSDNFGQAWLELLQRIFSRGQEVSPRGQKTYELLAATIHVEDGLKNILVDENRKPNYRFMVAEWLWIQYGLQCVKYLTPYNRRMAEFSDDGVVLAGAYGPRISSQWGWVTETLQRDACTRQGVVSIWTPRPGKSKDIPCTLSLQFLPRRGKLHLIATMRSSDFWLGLPYDFFSFSQLLNVLSGEVGLEAGSVTMHLGSSHLYDIHYRQACLCLEAQATTTIESPEIDEVVPHDLLRCFTGSGCYAEKRGVWETYHRVIHTKTSADALGVLRAAAPSY